MNEKFLMPAEWEPHLGTIMIWPERRGSWPYNAEPARPVFAEVIRQICAGEKVYLALSESGEESAKKLLGREILSKRVELWRVKTDDCWARDMGPTFVKRGGELLGVDWAFNAWGGEYNGLYPDYFNDDKFAAYACGRLGVRSIKARPFVLEGGSIHSDGSGTVITTEECLLSKGRNPGLTKAEIELKLKTFLGADRVIWLKRGILGDETDGHVDNICAFTGKNSVVLAWSDEGEQGEICRENYKILKENGLNVQKLALPETPVKITERDLKGFEFAEGEAVREEGERLAASYVNFYICNACVLVPQFGDKNDKNAIQVLKNAFPSKKIVPVFARELIVGGGNIHCLTQQVPLFKEEELCAK